jgi:hypothetical protein
VTARNRFLLLALVAAVLIAAFASLPTATKHALHLQGALHPWLHLFGFAVLAFLLLAKVRRPAVRVLLCIALLSFGYATEAGESRADGWPIEKSDVRIDASGVLLGSVCATLWSRSRQRVVHVQREP